MKECADCVVLLLFLVDTINAMIIFYLLIVLAVVVVVVAVHLCSRLQLKTVENDASDDFYFAHDWLICVWSVCVRVCMCCRLLFYFIFLFFFWQFGQSVGVYAFECVFSQMVYFVYAGSQPSTGIYQNNNSNTAAR